MNRSLKRAESPFQEYSYSDEEVAGCHCGSSLKEKKKCTDAHKKSLLAIMQEKKEKILSKRLREDLESDEETIVPCKLYEELQNKYILLKKQLKEKDFVLAEKEVKIKKLTEINNELSGELKKIRQLNIRLQEELLLKSPGKQVNQTPQPDLSGEQDSGLQSVPTVEQEDGNVNLGNGVVLDKRKWEIIQGLRSHSKFCKSLAVSIWGTETLQQRSVTGAKSNAVKGSVARPPLTPEKVSVIKECLKNRLEERGYQREAIESQLSLVRRSLSEKISDIRKRAQQT